MAAIGFPTGRKGSGSTRPSGEDTPKSGEQGYAVEFDMIGTDVGGAYDSGSPTVDQISRAVRSDPQMKAVSEARSLMLRSRMPVVEEAEGDTGEAEFVRSVLLSPASAGGMTTPMSDVVAQMTTAGDYGFAAFELVVEERDGKFVFRKVAFRPARTVKIVPDANGSFDGFRQVGFKPFGGGALDARIHPPNAFVYFRGGARRPLKGESALEAAYRAHVDKLKVMTLWREHLQQFALGVIVGTTSEQTMRDPKRRSIFRNMIRKIRGGGRMVKAPGETVELLTGQSKTDEFIAKVRYLDRQMAVSILMPQLTLGDGSTGSWALSKDQSDFGVQSLEADMREMGEGLTNHLSAKLVYWNFDDPAYPKITFPPLSENERTEARQFLKEKFLELDTDAREMLERVVYPAMGVDYDELKAAREKRAAENPSGVPEEEDPDAGIPESLRSNLGALERALAGMGGTGSEESGGSNGSDGGGEAA